MRKNFWSAMDASGAVSNAVPSERRPSVWVCADAAAVAREAARRIVELYRGFIASHGEFSVALAGGKTPRLLYGLLGSDEFREQLDWARVHLFWADERPVPPDHPESNYGMVAQEWLARVPLPAGNVHRMQGELPSLGQAAQVYEELLRAILPLDACGFPRFHLILLGLGADGHTASLFPGTGKTANTTRWVTTPQVEQLGTRRMTLTLPVINAAHHVMFLVTGGGKASVLRRVLDGDEQPALPAQLVRPSNGSRIFLVDSAAAMELEGR